MAIPRLAFWFGPLAAMGRLPAIDVDSVVQAQPGRVIGSQNTVGGLPRRDVLGMRRTWQFQWRRLLRSEWSWLEELWQAEQYGATLGDYYLRSPHEANVMSSGAAPFGGTPSRPGLPPTPAALSWSFNLAAGRRQQFSAGLVPCEVGEVLVARAFVGSSTGSTRSVNVGLRTFTSSGGENGDVFATFTAPTNLSAFLDAAHSVTIPAGTVACKLLVDFLDGDGRVCLPRITRGGEDGGYTPPGGSARVVMDDDGLQVSWVSPTEADVTLRLVEAGVA